MNRKEHGAIGVILLLAFLVVLTVVVLAVLDRINKAQLSPNNDTQTKQTSEPPRQLRGYNFLPKDFSAAGYSDFFTKLPDSKAAVTWAGDWGELKRSSGGSHNLAKLAKEHSFEPIFIVSTHKDAGGFANVVPIRPVEANSKSYIDSAVAFCKKNLPNYFGIGVETNRIYASSVSEFDRFVNLFDQTADAMRAACPSTKIFSAFQLEHLRGLRGGLYGGVNNEARNDWQLLDRFTKADFIAFTTYPAIVFKDPGDIPADYYSSIRAHTAKPVAFTEVAWPSQVGVAGWTSSEEEQARFTQRFLELTGDMGPLFSIWPFLYDQNLPDPFKGIGLFRPDGSPRQSYQTWTGQ